MSYKTVTAAESDAERSKGEDEKVSHFGLVRALLVGSIGTALEWYDFALYGFFAIEIGEAFFSRPSANEDHDEEVLGAFAAFGSAFFMRPLGGLIFGLMGDRWGRVPALRLSIALMMLATFSLGALPPVDVLGGASTLLLVAVRLLQGLSCGGQLVGSNLIVLERAPANRRCTTAGLLMMASNLGNVLASLVGASVRALCPSGCCVPSGPLKLADVQCWRVPFITGVLIFGVVAALSHDAEETPEVQAAIAEGKEGKRSCWEVTKNHSRELIQCLCVNSLAQAGFYASFVWIPTYIHDLRPKPRIPDAFGINTTSIGCLVALLPILGFFADCCPWGYEKQLIFAAAGVAGAAPVLYRVFDYGSPLQVLASQMVMAVLIAAFNSCSFPWMVQRVPDLSIRYVTLGVGVNVNAAVFGGLAPFISTRLAHSYGSFAVGLFVSLAALVTLVILVEEELRGRARGAATPIPADRSLETVAPPAAEEEAPGPEEIGQRRGAQAGAGAT